MLQLKEHVLRQSCGAWLALQLRRWMRFFILYRPLWPNHCVVNFFHSFTSHWRQRYIYLHSIDFDYSLSWNNISYFYIDNSQLNVCLCLFRLATINFFSSLSSSLRKENLFHIYNSLHLLLFHLSEPKKIITKAKEKEETKKEREREKDKIEKSKLSQIQLATMGFIFQIYFVLFVIDCFHPNKSNTSAQQHIHFFV